MRHLTTIAAILLCASTAWGGFGYGRVVGGTSNVTGGGSTITFYSNTDSIVSGQTPQVGSGTITITGGVSSVTGVVGNQWRFQGTASGVTIPYTGNIDINMGTIGFYITPTNWGIAGVNILTVLDSTQFFRIRHSTSASSLSIAYGSAGGASLTDSQLGSGTSYVEFAWNKDTANTSCRINGGSWSDTAATVGTFGTPSTVTIGPKDAISNFDVKLDQIKISSAFKADLYAVRDDT